MGRKNRKKGDSDKVTQQREAQARTGGSASRMSGVRWLTVNEAIAKSAPGRKKRR